MAKTKQMMETDERGVKYQFFPITHAGAVLGLKEFLEGDFFQADFDRVMALLEERSDKAFDEINKKSDAMEKHADEKIAEFDNKIAATNQTLATLEKEIADTQQTFENMDVFTKQESSANVIDQISGKKENVRKIVLGFSGKVAGSTIENKNTVKYIRNNTVTAPETGIETSTTGYRQLATLDNNCLKITTSTASYVSALVAEFDIFDLVTTELSEKFWVDNSAHTATKKIEVVETIISKIKCNIFGYATSPISNQLTLAVRNQKTTNWTNQVYINSDEVINTSLSLVSDISNFIDQKGMIAFSAYSQASNGDTAAAVNIDYIELEVTFNLSANTHIKSMIAAYCGEMQNKNISFEKVGEV